jgi:hypothetical protein
LEVGRLIQPILVTEQFDRFHANGRIQNMRAEKVARNQGGQPEGHERHEKGKQNKLCRTLQDKNGYSHKKELMPLIF